MVPVYPPFPSPPDPVGGKKELSGLLVTLGKAGNQCPQPPQAARAGRQASSEVVSGEPGGEGVSWRG